MRKVSSYKCPICKMEYKTLGGWSEHMHRHHPDEIPKGFTDLQYFYYTLTGKKSGSCVQCHKPTDWNEATGKYNRYCNNPKCKEQYCKVAKKRMIDKYGKIHLLNDPEMQRKMLSNRKIAGTYTFSDGSGKVPYVASYEKDFLMTMDTVLGLKATDIMSPSPHNYVYMYEGKPHFYIPDFYIPSLNLEIEIKDDQNGPNANKHPKIAAVDRVKEALKDETMAKNKSVNYFKVMDKSYTDFFKYVLELKECVDDDLKNTIISAMAIESVNDPENSFEMALEKALEYDDDDEFNGEGDYGFECLESVNKSKIDNDFVAKGHKSLSSFKCTKLTHELRKKYESESKMLKHAWESDATHDARIWLDGDKMVAHVCVFTARKKDPKYDGYNWISSLEVSPEYRGYGLGKQLLDFAVDTMGGTALGVYKDNEIAIKMYKDKGFKFLDKKRIHEKYPNYHDNTAGLMVLGSPAMESVNTHPVLYHGSNTKVTSITPHVSTHGKSWVYATADHDFALCYSGKQWNDLNINQAYHNGQLTLTEIEKGAFDKYFNCPGYIYSFPSDNFKEFNRHELVSEKEVVLGDNSVEYVPNVMDAIKKSGIKLYRYPNLPPYIKNREEYIRKKKELFANVSTLESTDEIYDEVEPAVEATNILSSKPKEMTASEFKKIPDSSILHMTRDAYFKNNKANGNTQYYGFYNPLNASDLMGILSIHQPENDSKCIDLIVVDDRYRRQGLATHMLDFAVNQYGANWLEVKTTNTPAISVYKKYGFKVAKTYQGKTTVVHRMEYHNKSVANEAVSTESLHFETPKELHTWMKNNFSYTNFTKLLSPEEMAAKKKGSCHDQALFAYTYLKKMGLKPKLLFFIAYKEGEVVGGMTHTLCYYEQNNKVWWFETAWNGAIGLRSYPTENAMRVDIFRRYMNLPDSKKFPELEFKEITPMEPGSNLAQYVDKALEVALTADERTDFGIPSLKKYPMPDPDHVKAAIRMFNHVDEEHEKELANNIIKYIKKYKMTDINVGKDNRFHKYYSPSEDAVITDVASQVPYGGAVIQRPMN